MGYRTKTYIAGDWSEDQDAIDQLYKGLPPTKRGNPPLRNKYSKNS